MPVGKRYRVFLLLPAALFLNRTYPNMSTLALRLANRAMMNPYRVPVAYLRRAAATAYANRATLNRAATIAQQAYRRYRRNRAQNARRQRPVQRIGNPVGRETARRTQVTQLLPADQKDDRTLYQYDITRITQGNAPNQRTRDIINFRGFKICMYILPTAVPQVPVFCNVAVISPKNNVVISPQAFFRSNAEERGVSFDNETLTALDYYCRPINSDEFNIISHKRFRLAPTDSTGQFTAKCNRTFMRYYKIRRQIRFTRVGELEVASTPIYVCLWFAREGYGAETGPEPAVNVDMRIISYFRNPRD